MGYLDGFLVTVKQHRLFGGKRVTTSYSGGRVAKKGNDTEGHDEKIAKPERLHGRHVLNRYEDGMEKCIGCELCAGVCPAKCIYVRGADNDPTIPTSPGERYGFVYEINYLRCIHCDLCVEACPTEAITEIEAVRVLASPTAATPSTPRPSCWSTTTASPSSMPWEDWRDGRGPATPSAWMRATSPSGDADFEGQVGWSGELGYGVRAPGAARPRPTPGRRQRSRTSVRWLRCVRRRGRLIVLVSVAAIVLGASVLASATRCTPRSAWCSRCSASPCCSSPRRPTSSPPCRSSSTPAPSSCCSCS